MADYRRYQPRRSGGSSIRWGWIVFGGLGLVVLWLIGRVVFSGHGTSTANNYSDGIQLVNENSNTNSQAVTNGNSNINAPSNTNSVATEAPDPSAVSLDACNSAISQFGSGKNVALTFNVAAENDQAKALLKILNDNHLAASFFVSGKFAEAHADFVQTIANDGFGVYNRSYDNPDFTTLTTDQVSTQLSKADTAILAATSQSTKPFFRPPAGATNAATVAAVKAAGYCTILWTVDGFDWQDAATADSVTARVVDKARAGEIIMLSAGYDVTAAAVTKITDQLKAKGYQFVSLVSLLTGS